MTKEMSKQPLKWISAILTVVLISILVTLVRFGPNNTDTGRPTIIVNATGGEVELFLRTKAQQFVERFGADLKPYTSEDGTVAYADMRSGTWQHGATVLRQLQVRIDGVQSPVELLSLMLHPPGIDLAFTEPFDAELAVSVCTSPETIESYKTLETDVYAGLSVVVSNAAATRRVLRISGSPMLSGENTLTARDSPSVDVIHYVEGVFQRKAVVQMVGGELEISVTVPIATREKLAADKQSQSAQRI